MLQNATIDPNALSALMHVNEFLGVVGVYGSNCSHKRERTPHRAALPMN